MNGNHVIVLLMMSPAGRIALTMMMTAADAETAGAPEDCESQHVSDFISFMM
jgi:hypothetical protein